MADWCRCAIRLSLTYGVMPIERDTLQDKFKIVDLIKTYPSRNIHGLRVAVLAFLTLISLITAPAALAQSYTLTTLASINGANGNFAEGGLTLGGSTLYGTTMSGGANNNYGTVFSVPITGGTPTILASFSGANGGNPFLNAGLTLSGSTLYGTTQHGGPNNNGTVFSVPITGGVPTILANFNVFNGEQPIAPLGSLTLSGSTLYGMTEDGGAQCFRYR